MLNTGGEINALLISYLVWPVLQYAKLAISLKIPGGGKKKSSAGGDAGAAAPEEDEDEYAGGLC